MLDAATGSVRVFLKGKFAEGAAAGPVTVTCPRGLVELSRRRPRPGLATKAADRARHRALVDTNDRTYIDVTYTAHGRWRDRPGRGRRNTAAGVRRRRGGPRASRSAARRSSRERGRRLPRHLPLLPDRRLRARPGDDHSSSPDGQTGRSTRRPVTRTRRCPTRASPCSARPARSSRPATAAADRRQRAQRARLHRRRHHRRRARPDARPGHGHRPRGRSSRSAARARPASRSTPRRRRCSCARSATRCSSATGRAAPTRAGAITITFRPGTYGFLDGGHQRRRARRRHPVDFTVGGVATPNIGYLDVQLAVDRGHRARRGDDHDADARARARRRRRAARPRCSAPRRPTRLARLARSTASTSRATSPPARSPSSCSTAVRGARRSCRAAGHHQRRRDTSASSSRASPAGSPTRSAGAVIARRRAQRPRLVRRHLHVPALRRRRSTSRRVHRPRRRSSRRRPAASRSTPRARRCPRRPAPTHVPLLLHRARSDRHGDAHAARRTVASLDDAGDDGAAVRRRRSRSTTRTRPTPTTRSSSTSRSAAGTPPDAASIARRGGRRVTIAGVTVSSPDRARRPACPTSRVTGADLGDTLQSSSTPARWTVANGQPTAVTLADDAPALRRHATSTSTSTRSATPSSTRRPSRRRDHARRRRGGPDASPATSRRCSPTAAPSASTSPAASPQGAVTRHAQRGRLARPRRRARERPRPRRFQLIERVQPAENDPAPGLLHRHLAAAWSCGSPTCSTEPIIEIRGKVTLEIGTDVPDDGRQASASARRVGHDQGDQARQHRVGRRHVRARDRRRRSSDLEFWGVASFATNFAFLEQYGDLPAGLGAAAGQHDRPRPDRDALARGHPGRRAVRGRRRRRALRRCRATFTRPRARPGLDRRSQDARHRPRPRRHPGRAPTRRPRSRSNTRRDSSSSQATSRPST